ncbi:chromosomal replication initiator protein DnaA [Marispirochaeta aestuarii]|uniref:chromosomal replication initiator protein DnaA n=1 Tax=Marispirochaeta aestuarii TaxID=1963862 RepID=UPI002ABD413E|nr:chromosomal replication initiator protein DnaA [Marispirochaeta aestuarii]
MNSVDWDYSLFWKEALQQLRHDLSEQEFMMWFKNLRYDSSRQDSIILAVPSVFYRDQVKQRYQRIIESKLQELSGSPIGIDYVIQAIESAVPSDNNGNNGNIKEIRTEEVSRAVQPNVAPPIQTRASVAAERTLPRQKHPHLRGDYTFENFVIGENNSFAANAAIAIAKNPGTSYNPCLIYGGVGLGKTHLVQSIGNAAHMNFDAFKVVYVTSETFTNEFIQAIKDGKNAQFKSRYRNVDLLLIDDIQFLQGKDQTQEELFHTFNALYDANKQMVFTCDRPVSELKNLTARLQSRFERGLNVDLQPPNFETRYAILKRKIEEKGVDISDEVITLICNRITTNVRDLEAALTKLIAYADLLNKRVTLEIAEQQLKDVFNNTRTGNISIDVIQKVVADHYSLSHNDMRGKKRTKAIAFPRQIAMYIVREITEYSTTEVGLAFGGRDHTTVMHACQRVESRMKTDSALEPTIQQLIRSIKEYGTNS